LNQFYDHASFWFGHSPEGGISEFPTVKLDDFFEGCLVAFDDRNLRSQIR
jgi:hypothetical protein